METVRELTTKAQYVELLARSYEKERELEIYDSPYAFLAMEIFGLITYDDDEGELFGRKAVDVCLAITRKLTIPYQQDSENYRWYLLMVNMPFFQGKLDWGTSIRGAWWDYDAKAWTIQGQGGLWRSDSEQLANLTVPREEWDTFVEAMRAFAEMKPEA